MGKKNKKKDPEAEAKKAAKKAALVKEQKKSAALKVAKVGSAYITASLLSECSNSSCAGIFD
eukprot:SAG22_NODE_7221_length_760_cov_1.125567_1_plen_62_part_00